MVVQAGARGRTRRARRLIRQPTKAVVASAMATAALCWKAVDVSNEASVEFCMFPHSIKTWARRSD